MFARKAVELVQEVARCDADQILPFDADGVQRVLEEAHEHHQHMVQILLCGSLPLSPPLLPAVYAPPPPSPTRCASVASRNAPHLLIQSAFHPSPWRVQGSGVEWQETRLEDATAVMVHHQALLRNKRCLLAYLNARMDQIRRLRWQLGATLPRALQERLSAGEGEWLAQYSQSLGDYMADAGLDLTVSVWGHPREAYDSAQVRLGDCMADAGLDLTLLTASPCSLPHHAHCLTMLTASLCSLPHHAHCLTMLTASPCSLPHHAHCLTMLTPSPCSLPHHAHCLTMLTASPCSLPHHAHSLTMLTASPCSLPHHAHSLTMLTASPCSLPHHAHCLTMLTASPCSLPHHAHCLTMLTASPCSLPHHAHSLTMLTASPCSLPHHAHSLTMLTASPCSLPHHAHCLTMLTPSPCSLPHHAHCLTMLTPSPCSLPHHAHFLTMLTASPCSLPHHAHCLTMLTPSPCSLPHHAHSLTMLTPSPCSLPHPPAALGATRGGCWAHSGLCGGTVVCGGSLWCVQGHGGMCDVTVVCVVVSGVCGKGHAVQSTCNRAEPPSSKQLLHYHPFFFRHPAHPTPSVWPRVRQDLLPPKDPYIEPTLSTSSGRPT
ncbi:unnamed protein product [Closterium sp. NIES-65]|nr:unnamed protein product [Closterium sp. NIES-65]